MVIAGAGGHALEVLDALISKNMASRVLFYDDLSTNTYFQETYPVVKNKEELSLRFKEDPHFIIGVGDCKARKYFYELFESLGGKHLAIHAKTSIISDFAQLNQTDVFNFCFIGSNVISGKGTMINSGSQVHHEVQIGQFSNINPGVQLIGKCHIGDNCSIGTGAIVLPKIKIGNNVTVGAGTVVTKDVPDNCTLVGVPGKIIKIS